MRIARAALFVAMVAPSVSAAPSTSSQSTTQRSPAGSAAGSSLAERQAETKANAAVGAAVRDLLHEFAAGSSGGKTKLRTSCDYFNEHHASDVTPKAIVSALDQHITDDARANAYVKWQLMSGLQGAIDEKELPRLLRIYHNAPPPIAQPGETQEEQTKYELMRRNARKEDVPKLNEDLAAAQQERERDNTPILAFRDELFARLPEQNYDCLRAAFEDAYARMKAGSDPQKIMQPLLERTHSWMASPNATPQQLAEMSRLTMTLSKENSPDFYAEAAWNQRSYKVTWRRKSYDLNKLGQMDKLARELADASRTASSTGGGGLKFKDETDKSKKSKSSKSDNE